MAELPRSLPEFEARFPDEAQFPDEAACARWLLEKRWPDGFRCPACGHAEAWELGRERLTLQCTACERQVSVTAGTALHGSHLPLRTWFLVLQLRLHEHEPAAPVAGLSDSLVRPPPEGPGQDEGRPRRATTGCQAGDRAADLGDAERHEELASGPCAPFSPFRPARSPASRASASIARVTCRCQPRQLRTS